MTQEAVQPFNDLAKFTLLSICLSSFLSYIIFIFALIKHYYKDHWNRFRNCKINWSRAYDELESQLHPFNNDDDEGRHTKLNGNRRHCFCMFFWLNLIILLLIFIVFIIGQYALYEPPKPIEKNNKRTIIIEWIEGATAITYFYSHLCTITSCFIFSKLMYGIQRKIINQETRTNEIITAVNNNIGNSDNSSEHGQENITDAGTNSINSGTHLINGGSNTINGGSNTINGGEHCINGGTNIINNGSNTIKGGTNNINGGTNTIRNGTVTINGGTNIINGGTLIINGGTNTINGGTVNIINGGTNTCTINGETVTINGPSTIATIYNGSFQSKLTTLMKADDTFITCATKTLSIFQLWFFVHWVFYIITSFLTIALSIEAILLHIRATQHHTLHGVHFSNFEIPLLILVSISNVLMFFYPCFQAASITRARKRYIRHLIKKYKDDDQRGIVDLFVKYLKSREFGFRLYIGCTYIPFSLNIAYTSVIIGVFGIVLSVLASIAT